MPRFFFDFRQHGELQPDDMGLEFPSAEQAYLGAMEAVRAMWSELLAKRENPRLCSFEIRGEHGEPLYVVPFTEVLEACGDVPRPTSQLKKTIGDARVIHASALRLRDELNQEFNTTRRMLLESAELIARPV